MTTNSVLFGICCLLAVLYEGQCDCDPAIEFECANKECIPGLYICNGKDECGDNSDEAEPCAPCPPKFMTCKSGRGCVFGGWMCDGINNCEDGSDERDEEGDCPPCPGGMFQCASGICIHPEYICDGYDDCGDNSDEVDPASGMCPPCLRGMFSCRTEKTGCRV